MNFGFTEEQELLRDQVRRFLDQHASSESVRKLAASERGFSDEHWKQMADLGWLGLIVDADYDGVGLDWVDLIVVLEEMGRRLFPSPFIANTLVASTLSELGSDAQKKRFLPALARGEKIATLAILDVDDTPIPAHVTLTASDTTLSGSKPFVPDAGNADQFLIAYRDGTELRLAVIEAASKGVTVSTSPTMDTTKRTGTLHLDGVEIDEEATLAITDADLERLFDKGVVAVTAEMIGAAEAATLLTANYAKERLQFGNPIGKYQGVKHRLAEMYVDVESFKSLLYYAAWTVNESADELPRSASLAKAYASDAFTQIGIDSIQLHGAIGFTAEYDAQLYLKRSKWARPMFGDADFHYERVARFGEL